MNRLEPTQLVFIVDPHEHGNGGCHGSSVVDSLPLEEALKKSPYLDYPDKCFRSDHPYEFHPRICKSKDMNDCIYVWEKFTMKESVKKKIDISQNCRDMLRWYSKMGNSPYSRWADWSRHNNKPNYRQKYE